MPCGDLKSHWRLFGVKAQSLLFLGETRDLMDQRYLSYHQTNWLRTNRKAHAYPL